MVTAPFPTPPAPTPSKPCPDNLIFRPVTDEDLPTIAKLHARTFGPGRFARTAYRIREGAPPVSAHCKVACIGTRIVAALRFTEVMVGKTARGLFLGPLVVDPEYKRQHIGSALITDALADIDRAGQGFVILVGDEPYYQRHGFAQTAEGQIICPGPVAPHRILIRAAPGKDPAAFCGQLKAVPA
ncbi:MAG: N-acetyltransferase [Pseudomonadota bacterium]